MGIIGWIRQGDKASCGATVIDGSPTDISHGRPYTYMGAQMACRKRCVITEGYPLATLPNGQPQVLHGHCTSGGCPLISTLNGIDGVGTDDSQAIAVGFREKSFDDGTSQWVPVYEPLTRAQCDYDQHLILEDQDGNPLDGVPYRITDARGAIIDGTTGADGRTEILAGHGGETMNCNITLDSKT